MKKIEELEIKETLAKGIKKEFYLKTFLCVFCVLFLLLCIFYYICLPKLKLKGDKEITISYNESYKEKGYEASLYGKDVTEKVKVRGNVNTKKVGIYQLFYSIENGILEEKKIRTIRVVDKDKPVITLEGEEKVTVCPNTNYKEQGYQAYDAYDGDITNKIKITEKKEHFIYLVEDSSHNKTIKKRSFVYEDKTVPSLKLKGNDTIYVIQNGIYKEEGVEAIDNCDGDITSLVTKEGSVNTKVPGTYEITYKVTDKSGNTSSIKRRVVVYKNISSGCIDPGVIYLTFDDGPQAGTTEQILNILKEENVKATFFVTSKGPDNLLKRELEEGHTIGLHTSSHNYAEVYASESAYFNDLKAVSDRVKKVTGIESRIIRFPGGSSNTISRRYQIGIMSHLTKEVVNRGYLYYDWNVDSEDAGRCVGKDANCIYTNITNHLSLNKCNMILMHDIKVNTANAIRDIIHYGKNNGYHFAKITEETPMIKQGVNN